MNDHHQTARPAGAPVRHRIVCDFLVALVEPATPESTTTQNKAIISLQPITL